MLGETDWFNNDQGSGSGETGPQQCHDVIELTGLNVFGYHGVYPSEQEMGQPFVVDLALHLDLAAAAAADDLSMSVDYAMVARQVVSLVARQPVQLIETLAQRVADCVLENARISAVEVTVHKPQAPLGIACGDVAVKILRRRSSVLAGDEPLAEEAAVPEAVAAVPDAVAAVPAVPEAVATMAARRRSQQTPSTVLDQVPTKPA